jgi:predicted dehydrogenase
MKILILTKRKNLEINQKNIKIVHNLKDALNEKPDFAVITNETRYHIPITLKLAKFGLDLFIEKPLSDSMKDIKKLKKIICERKLITQIGCNLRFYPPIKKIKVLIEKQIVGKPISVQVETGSYLPDWHPWEDYRKGYAAKKELGGGILLTAIHEIDYLYWIFGKITSVSSITGKFSDLETNTDDLSVSLIKFKNNLIGEVHLDYFQRPFFKRCKIRCTRGIILWDSESNKVKIYNTKLKKWVDQRVISNYKLISKKVNIMYMDEMIHFLHCIENRKKTINDFNQGLDVLEIALAIRKASEKKKTVLV